MKIDIVSEESGEIIGDFSLSYKTAKELKKMAEEKDISFEELIRQILIKEAKKVINENESLSSDK